MAYYFEEPSHTFGEYLLVPGYSSADCIPANVSLRTPIVRFKKGDECPLYMNIPMVSAVMQSVSNDTMAIALAKEGGISFIYGSQTIEQQAEMIRRVKSHKAGFVTSDSNIKPDNTLQDVLDLKARTGHSTVAVTADGSPHGRLLGIITSRDFRINKVDPKSLVRDYMTKFDDLIVGEDGITLSQANDLIWKHKLNSLPVITGDGHLVSMVFRKDYASHEEHPLELLDENHRYVVGAGINTRDYMERVPALLEAGVDILCIDSSEGFSEWQKRALNDIHNTFGHQVKVGAGNVVDRDGFLFLAENGAGETENSRDGMMFIRAVGDEGKERCRRIVIGIEFPFIHPVALPLNGREQHRGRLRGKFRQQQKLPQLFPHGGIPLGEVLFGEVFREGKLRFFPAEHFHVCCHGGGKPSVGTGGDKLIFYGVHANTSF